MSVDCVALGAHRDALWKLGSLERALVARGVATVVLNLDDPEEIERIEPPCGALYWKSRSGGVCDRIIRVERRGVRAVNSAGAVARSLDRAVAMEAAQRAGAPVPRWATSRLGECPIGGPVVVKSALDDRSARPTAYHSVAEASRVLGAETHAHVQARVDAMFEAKWFVIGGRALGFAQPAALGRVGVARRRAFDDPGLAALAVRVARQLGLEVAGVDMLVSAGGAWVSDVNPSQGLHVVPGAYALLSTLLVEVAGGFPWPSP